MADTFARGIFDMKNMKKSLLLFSCLLLSSCNQSPYTSNVVNRYKDFASAKKAFDQGVEHEFKGESVATIFDFKENKTFADFTFVYYVRGLCPDYDKQVSYDDICENIISDSALIFLSNENSDICIELINRCVASYSYIKLDGIPEEKDDAYRDYIKTVSIVTERREYEDGDYWPEDYSKFSIEKNEINTILKYRFEPLRCGSEGTAFGNILFSKRTSVQDVEKYSVAIRDFIVSKTNTASK